MNLVYQILRRLITNFPRTIKLGGHKVALPAGHRLDWYRFRHSRYDEPVAEISILLQQKYRGIFAIDIGANVGDTAALMASSANVSVLCIEGNQKYIPLLKSNLANISNTSEIEESYVGHDDGDVAGRVVTIAGTASIELSNANLSDAAVVRMRSLKSILEDHAQFQKSQLLKVDTDGFDSKIIISAADVISIMKPILYIEYSPIGPEHVEHECKQMIEVLIDIGYVYYHIFDNFGNHLLRLKASEIHHMLELNAYVRSSRKDLKPAIFYFDICAITEHNRDISEELLSLYLNR